MNSLTLKWGTVKGWNLDSEDARAALQKWAMSEQKQALLEAIDHMDEIWLDWGVKQVSRRGGQRVRAQLRQRRTGW